MSDEAVDPRKNLPASARQLIAHARNDITIPFFSTLLQPQDETLIARGGGKGLKLYDEVERDTHARAVLQKRKLALTAREWEVKAPEGSGPAGERAEEFIERVLSTLNFDQICLDLLDATLKGYAISEIVWQRVGSEILPEKIVAHDQRRFAFDEHWKPRLLTMAQPSQGEELPDRKFIVHRFGVKGNNPYGLGLGSVLFWPVLFKREGVTFWLTFLEKFASPTPVGAYPHGTLPEDQDRLLRSLQAMVQSGAIVVPLGSEVKYLEASRAGNASYEEWCRYWDTQMALAVFGSTLATHIEGQGSRAAAETHKEGEEQIIDSDGDLLSDTLKGSLIQWLIDYNMPGAPVPSVRRIRAKNEALHEALRKQRAQNAAAELNLLFDLAGRIPKEHFAEIASLLGDADLMPKVPMPVLEQLAPHLASSRTGSTAPATGAPGTEADKALSRQMAFAEGQGELASLAHQLGTLAQADVADLVGQIQDLAWAGYQAGENADVIADRLLELAGRPVDPLGRLIGDALTVAEATGIAAVKARGK